MKRIYKVFLILIIIQVISLYVCNSYAKVTGSLSEFMKNNGMDKMTGKQIEAKTGELKRKMDAENSIKATEISTTATAIIDGAKGTKGGYEEKMKYLEKGFKGAVIPKGNEDDPNFTDENDPAYQYLGYMIGNEYITYKKNLAESEKNDKKGKTAAEQFDEKYKKFKKLSDEDKKDKKKMNEYSVAMNELYSKLSKSEKTDKRTEQLDEVETAFVEADDYVDEVPDIIYQYPAKNETTAGSSLDDMIGDADRFINSAGDSTISQTSLQKFSKTYYNILFTIGVVVATLVGLVLGIRFMISGAEGKANIKELLVPYIVGCVVVFGAFAIWKLLVSILSGM